MGDDLQMLPDAVKLSRHTVRMIWQNLFWAFIYNLICIPLAAGLLYAFGIDWQITPSMGECIDGIFQCECGAQQFATEIYVTIANHRTWINIVPLFHIGY